jgi:membrane-associated phospholipid phosphatase
MRHATAALLLVLNGIAGAQSSTERPRTFSSSDAYWAGAFLAGSIALSRADARIAQSLIDSSLHASHTGLNSFARHVAKIQEGTLTVGNIVLYAIGRLTKSHTLADVAFHATESVVVGTVVSQAIRGPLGRSRPYYTDYKDQYDFHPFQGFTNFKYRAFPSIHTEAAFAVATVYTLETQRRNPDAVWIVAPIAYAIAAGPGLARLYNGQHWASDILFGAFVGTFVGAKVVRYNHEVNPDNRVNRFFLGAKNVQVGVSGSDFSARYSRTF